MKRFFAEWEEQDGIMLSFPHEDTDWKPYLAEVREVFCQIIYSILQVEKCLLICKNKQETLEILKNFYEKKHYCLESLDNLYALELPSNDTWARDFGAISIKKGKKIQILDYGFNGWGLKFASNFDNKITKELHKKGVLKNVKTKKMILEGGSIESNGEGILLTNTQCLLEQNRNPYLSKKKIEKLLKKDFGLEKVLWLNHGYLRGDDTDSHIDTLARFVDKNTICYIKCEDKNDEHYTELAKMEKELKALKNAKGESFKLVALPFCTAKTYDDERLPATYANFLFINGAILLPIYNDENDKKAIEIMQKTCPKHKIIPIDCSVLIRQHGSLHCVTMQFPKGALHLNAII